MAQKKNDSEYVCVHYGIHPKTFEVESVWETRGGVLSYNSLRHVVLPGRSTQSEISIVFGLTETILISANMLHSPASQQMIDDLKKKAEEMRQSAK